MQQKVFLVWVWKKLKVITGIVIGTLLLNAYLPAYVSKKAENLATKEDIGAITQEVKQVEQGFLTELERVKTQLSDESNALIRRRQLYDEVVKSLRIFLKGSNATEAQRTTFLEHYQTLWLWAPDSVIHALNTFLTINRRFVVDPHSVSDTDQQQAFAEVILAMRRDIGFPKSELQISDYQFVNFRKTQRETP